MNYILITTAQHNIPNQALERSEFARRLNNGIGICTVQVFGSRESAAQFANKIITAVHSYATPAENTRGHWTTPYSYFYSRMWHNFVPFIIPCILDSSYKVGHSWNIELKKYNDGELIYRLFYFKNEEQQYSYDYSSRLDAVKQAKKILDRADLEPTTEENDNGYWHGINADSQDIRLELHILVPNSEEGYKYFDYMNISPIETLSNNCYERFRANILTVKGAGGLLAGWIFLLCLSVLTVTLSYWCVFGIIIDILGIANTIKKL